MKRTNPVTIVAFGDSITAAMTELPDEPRRWPYQVEAELRIRFPDISVKVINAGATVVWGRIFTLHY